MSRRVLLSELHFHAGILYMFLPSPCVCASWTFSDSSMTQTPLDHSFSPTSFAILLFIVLFQAVTTESCHRPLPWARADPLSGKAAASPSRTALPSSSPALKTP